MAENNTHTFIADIGKNYGSREDLKIFTILKSDFKESNKVSAETISFSYEDQTYFQVKQIVLILMQKELLSVKIKFLFSPKTGQI